MNKTCITWWFIQVAVTLASKWPINIADTVDTVAGGREFENYALMSEKLNDLFIHSSEFNGSVIKIISGMAKGADTLAIRYADEHKLTKVLFPANWKSYPRIAGFLRNEDMLSIATHLIAFWDGKSSGTKDMIDIAQEKGIPVWIFNY